MEVLLMVIVWVFFGFIFCLLLSKKWNEIIYRRKGLPPGSMGWLFFGETNEFLKQGPEFMKNQRTRFGHIFKSHILGSPTIISMEAELNRYILLNESKGLIPGYPKSMLEILGKRNIAAVCGSKHRHIRNNMLSLIGTYSIKDRLFSMIDKYTRVHLSKWVGFNVDVQEKTMDMVFFVALKQIAEVESEELYKMFKIEFDKLLIGSLSLPIYIPGTNYYRGFKGRGNIVKILTELIEKRRASRANNHDDLLELLLREMDAKNALNDVEIIDQIITILYSGCETVSTTLMMAVKYLHDHQEALQELRDEHFSIRQRKNSEQPLDWDDYKSMRFTRAVVFETMRLATVVNGVLRKTTRDMKLNGFLVPKGWRIYVYTREINYDPILYEEPLKFNPWRWLDKNLEAHNYCFLFGGGTRLCPGKELGIVTISVFLHYFVSTCRWEEVGGEVILQFPRVEAPNGYHINVRKM